MLTINRRDPNLDYGLSCCRKISYLPPTNDYATGYGRISLAIKGAFRTKEDHTSRNVDLALTWPGHVVRAEVRFTMWEADKIPVRVKQFLNDGALIVPCEHNRQVFHEAGFKNRIHVVPLWGDAEFSPMPEGDILRFICIGKDNGVRSRKGIDDLISCFKQAFPIERDVTLTIKSSADCFERFPGDDRITIIRSNLSISAYNDMLSSHHCGVFLSGLEAWNLPACELMAAGRPSILVPYGGPTEFSTPETSWHLDFEMTRSPDCHPYYGVGHGARPIKDSIISAMRECYSNRSLLLKKAEASRVASLKFTKKKFIERMDSVMMAELGIY